MLPIKSLRQPGIIAAFAAAILFGVGTPLAKWLLDSANPWMMAGLLYLGSGIGLGLYRLFIKAPSVHLPRNEVVWFAGAILMGGIVAPVLLMFGLVNMPASGTSLLLNAESAFTALVAWFIFKENVDRQVALGMAAIVAGAVVLSWPADMQVSGLWPSLAILGACFAWSIDNNLTRKVSLADATWIATVKGLVSGPVNMALAFFIGASLPALPIVAASLVVGLFAYGISLVLFVVGLRHLGTARTGAYFSIAPFFGALVAVMMGDTVTIQLLAAGTFMALGVWLHLSEHHEHVHGHEEVIHDHEHLHDEHHIHDHDLSDAPDTGHSHLHRHDPLTHTHTHYPDAHHRHRH